MASQLEFDTVLYVLDKHLPPACTVLDLGLESEAYAPHLLKRGFRVVAPDADVTRLDSLSDKNFQAVLCLGPYSQLKAREKRRRCLLECRRVLGDRGLVAVSYLNRTFAVGAQARGVSLDDAHFTSPEEVDAEVRSCGFSVVEHVGADGVYDSFPEALDGLEPERYQDFLWYHLRTCNQPSARGTSRHGLILLRKE